MIALAFSDTVGLGSLLVAGTVLCAAIALVWVYARRESGAVWRSVAEGLEAKVEMLEDSMAELKHDLEIEKAKPNQELLVSLVSQSLGSMAAVTKHVSDVARLVKEQKQLSTRNVQSLTGELLEQRELTSAAMAAMTTTMQHTGVLIQDLQKEVAAHEDRALERHTAAMEQFARSKDDRTRSTD